MRRTKEEAERTREQILAAALAIFRRDGVSHATLEDIARAAHVTRGAIYWHFANKKALFRALRDNVSVPLIDRTDFALLQDSGTTDPLTRIERFLMALLELLETDAPTRAVFDILMYRCEYVGDLAKDLDEFALRIHEMRDKLERTYEDAEQQRVLREGLSASLAATETTTLVIGMIRLELLLDPVSPIRTQLTAMIAGHVAGHRRGPPG